MNTKGEFSNADYRYIGEKLPPVRRRRALVEINPEMPETKRTTWKEFDLIEPSRAAYYRREITWNVFNEKANRFANLLIERGIKKGEKSGDSPDELSGMVANFISEF